MNLQIDLLGNPLTSPLIQMGWEISIEPYANRRFVWIGNTDHRFGKCSVLNPTPTWTDSPESSLTLPRCGSRSINRPPRCMYLCLEYTVYLSLLHSHYLCFNFESLDAAHMDRHFSRHSKSRCRRLTPHNLNKYIILHLLSRWRPPPISLELAAPCQLSIGGR